MLYLKYYEVYYFYLYWVKHFAMRQRDTHAAIGLEAVRSVVDDFYDRIQRHPTLAEPFKRVKDWPEHKARLSHFWWISLGGERYRDDRYRVAATHLPLGVNDALVDDWLALFRTTLEDHLEADLAAHWYQRAEHMGRSIRMLADWKPGGHGGLARPA